MVWVALVGVEDHQEDLQMDHQGVVEESLNGGIQFQQPDLKLWAHCALRPRLVMLGVPNQGCARGCEK